MSKTPNAKDIAAAHDKRKTRMRILTMRNDSPELHEAGGQALESGSGNARRGMLSMMNMDKKKVQEKKKEKARQKEMPGPQMEM